jgi:VWFA-related protein
VLAESAIEVHELPPPSAEEQAKLAALKADVPGLYMPSSVNEEDALPATTAVGDSSAPTSPSPEPSTPAQVSTADPSAGTTAGGPAGTSAPMVTFKASARVVGIDVVVTDGDGHPVRGLPQKDFEVTEDGKQQEIRYFKEFTESSGSPAEQPKTPAAKEQTPNMFTNSAQPAEPGSVTMILLDLLNTSAPDQEQARQQLIKFVKARSGRSTKFALCTLSGSKSSPLRLIQGFTPDENLLLAAAAGKKFAPKSAAWRAAAEGTGNVVSSVGEFAQDGGRTSGWQNLLAALEGARATEQGLDTDARLATTVSAMAQLATYLAGIPGRKSLVWLSGSFPISLSLGTSELSTGRENHNYSRMIQQAATLLAKSQVAVYPVDVRGLEASAIMSARNSGSVSTSTAGAADLLTLGGNDPVSSNEAMQQQAQQEIGARASGRIALTEIAAATGGKAFFNTNAIAEAISTASLQSSNYYSISYHPANEIYNGRFRKIKVQLAAKGYHLYYRPGYFAVDPSTSTQDLARDLRRTAMQFGSPQSSQIHFMARVVPIGPKTRIASEKTGGIAPLAQKKPTPVQQPIEVQHHSIDFAIDSSDLRIVPVENGSYRISLIHMIASFDAEGRALTGTSNGIEPELSPEVYKEVLIGGFRVHEEVDVPVAAASLRIGIQDRLTGTIGTVDVPLPVPPSRDMPRMVKVRTSRETLPEIEPD